MFIRKRLRPLRVQWQIIDVKGKDKIYNIYVEGVSALTNIRIEIGAILDKNGGDVEKLIAYLQKSH